jgi:hypothetical protein
MYSTPAELDYGVRMVNIDGKRIKIQIYDSVSFAQALCQIMTSDAVDSIKDVFIDSSQMFSQKCMHPGIQWADLLYQYP